MMRNLFRRSLPAADHGGAQKVLIASEGRRISEDVIQLAARIARGHGGGVRVLSVARLWGTSFGLPNPGLKPSRREMAEQEDNVAQAIARLEALGVAVDGHIVVTRQPAKSILREVARLNCAAVVMGADKRHNPLIGAMMWSQEPYRVRRAARVAVHLVEGGLPAQPTGAYAEFKAALPAQSRLFSREKKIHSS